MKRLICLISTKGKSSEQASKETWEAYQNYQRVKVKAEKEMSKDSIVDKQKPKL